MEEYIQCVEEDSRLDALEVRDEDDLDQLEEWTESFTDIHTTKPHPAPGGTCQDKWQKLS